MDTLDSTKPTTKIIAPIISADKIESRTFKIVNKDGTESGTYRGANPRNAALKAVRTLT